MTDRPAETTSSTPDSEPVDRAVPAGDPAAGARVWRAVWRQHRFWVLGVQALVLIGALVLGIALLLIPACASTAWWETPGATCSLEPSRTLWRLYRVGMLVLPILVGVVLGAITFGPDAEHRTQVYALSQSVGRMRWWMVKVVVTAAPVFVVAALLGLANLGAIQVANDSFLPLTRLTSPGFDLLGLTPATRFLVAYAAAAAAAAVWRTVGGVVVGLVVAGVLVVGSPLLQPLVVPHERALIPIKAWLADTTGYLGVGSDSAYQWSGYADAEGRPVDVTRLACEQPEWDDCLVNSEVAYRLETFVADEQFPRMMLIIDGVNLLVAAGFLVAGARGLRRRDL